MKGCFVQRIHRLENKARFLFPHSDNSPMVFVNIKHENQTIHFKHCRTSLQTMLSRGLTVVMDYHLKNVILFNIVIAKQGKEVFFFEKQSTVW